MKKYKIFFISFFASILAIFITLGFSSGYGQQKPTKDQVVMKIVTFLLANQHYQPKDFNDDFSEKVYNEFLNNLDYAKRFLTEGDIAQIGQYRYQIDDQIKENNFDFFNKSVELFTGRLRRVEGMLDSLLAKPFDFNKDESFVLEEENFPRNDAEMTERWRKYLKYSTLVLVSSEVETEEKKASEDSIYKQKSFSQIEASSREKVLKNQKDYFKYLREMEHEEWFSLFVNAITINFDPHTGYFEPKSEEDFNMSISGQLEGIGAQLQSKDGFITVAEVIAGSPSWKQGELKTGDKLLEVAQGQDIFVSIVGMRLDNAVKLIRGKKGTEVRLKVQKADGSTKIIPLIRDVVEIEETFVRSSIVEKDGKKYGVIYLPKFYINFENRFGRDCALDVEKEINYLKEEGVLGIVMDLRGNGGGSLQSVVKIGGLFIEKGPIVQVKSRERTPGILSDNDPAIAWDGPLVILVNELSASASEILAAAMQDYGRAVIVGTEQTYGKGTVQSMQELDEMINRSLLGDEKLGALKLTIQKFYRINGASTQLHGVAADVVVPDRYSVMEVSEKEEKTALGWDEIQAAGYARHKESDKLPSAIEKSRERVKNNAQAALIEQDVEWIISKKGQKEVSLNLKKYNEENRVYKQESKKFDGIEKYNSKLTFTSPAYETQAIRTDTVLSTKRNKWHKELSSDLYIEEAVNILGELSDTATQNGAK